MNLLLSTIISILTFGAVADNAKTNNAQAINKAIEAAAEKGGGKVVVPAGTFATGTIYLKAMSCLFWNRGLY